MRTAIERDLTARTTLLDHHDVLGAQAARLERQLANLGSGPIYLPEAKALLSRDGGVCPEDGARLGFHPFEPERHRCERCGGVFTGARHHRAWIARYQLWLAERAVHCALLGALRDCHDLSRRAGDVLEAYSAKYRTYPNVDNVLGPTRLFFSTYLESIWLIQICVAALLLEVGHAAALSPEGWRAVRSMVAESAGLIASFDEGSSNRQVWNDVALIAAGGVLEHEPLIEHGAGGRSGLFALLDVLGSDGHWHEGENYHLFALRGFLLGAELLRWHGANAYAGTRLGRAFGAPLDTLLPDFTLPARGDAPYGVSVRQPRFAELWEIGRARTDDPRLNAVLTRLYQPGAPELEDAGLVELAEQEQNRPAHRQHRDRLGWKALLWMRPDPPAPGDDRAGSVLLEDRGVAVLRARDRVVMVECGRGVGGHAHPDRLHLSCHWDGPVLADFGTGSYVQPSLHWYRSALAHNAPIPAGGSQAESLVICDAFAGEGDWQWCRVRGEGVCGPGTAVERSVVWGPDLLVDTVRVEAPPGAVVDLPVHPVAELEFPTEPAANESGWRDDAGHESGYDRITVLGRLPAGEPWSCDGGGATLHLTPREGETVLVARAPGPPTYDLADGRPLAFLIRRAGGAGTWILCVTPGGRACRVTRTDTDLVVETGGRRIRLAEGDDDLTIHEDGHAPVRLAARPSRGAARRSEPSAAGTPRATVVIPLVDAAPTLETWPAAAAGFDLGARAYRRSESRYGEAGTFHGRVEVVAWGDALSFRFDVTKDDVVVRGAQEPDPALDNEPADIHSDGVQCYVGRRQWAGYLALPDLERGAIRVRPVAGTAARRDAAHGTSRRTSSGYQMLVHCATGAPFQPGEQVRFSAVVNEMRSGRMRRAGQLALAGGGWVYLRGDRESPAAALVGEVG